MGAAGAIPVRVSHPRRFASSLLPEASVLYVLTLAEVHGIHPEDFERRRLLVQTVLIGTSAIAALNKGADEVVPHWGKQIVNAIPMPAVDKANKLLAPRFITKYGEKLGVIVLSKQVPFGLGIGVGALSNHLIGRTIVGSARNVFGPSPEFFEPRPDPLTGTPNGSRSPRRGSRSAATHRAERLAAHAALDFPRGRFAGVDVAPTVRSLRPGTAAGAAAARPRYRSAREGRVAKAPRR